MSFIKSRETLKALSRQELQKYAALDKILFNVFTDIIYLDKTKYVFNLEPRILGNQPEWYNFFPNGIISDGFRLELLEMLKKTYADCDVTYNETLGHGGMVVEQLVTIDWT